ARERLVRLAATIDALRRLWAGESVTSGALGLHDAVLAPPPVQRPGPPVWVAAMRPRALPPAAQRGDGGGAAFLTPAAVAARGGVALAAAGRPREALRRSVELDAAIADTRAEAIATVEQFCRRRGITREHPLLQATLAGDVDVIIAQVLAYRKAGATDLMIG